MERDIRLSGHSNHGHRGKGGDYGSSRRFLGNCDNCVHVLIPFVRNVECGAGLRALMFTGKKFPLGDQANCAFEVLSQLREVPDSLEGMGVGVGRRI